jgi:hypothetical protein
LDALDEVHGHREVCMRSWVLLATFIAVSVQPLTVSWSQTSPAAKNESRPASPTSKKITITGFLSSCYKPTGYLVFITSSPRAAGFESEAKTLRADGRFTFILDAATLKPGDYFLNFGRTKRGAGGQKFTLTSDTTKIDLREIGECDV